MSKPKVLHYAAASSSVTAVKSKVPKGTEERPKRFGWRQGEKISLPKT
jgi:energy-converting hydrogenase Eha subunit A